MSDILIREVCVFFSGILLCWSGTLTQAVSQNSLASPSTLGFDGLAVFFVLLGTLFYPSMPLVLTYLLFFFFLLGSSLFFYQKNKEIRLQSFILAGLSFNLFMGALFALSQFFYFAYGKDFPTQVWFGQFRFAKYTDLAVLIVSFLLGIFSIGYFIKSLSYLSLGKNFSSNFVYRPNKVIVPALLLALFFTSTVVFHFGVFSFLGLIFPHILRSFSCFRRSLKNEFIWGAPLMGAVLIFFDLLVYHFDVQGSEVPVGLISSILGALFLLFILWKKNKTSLVE